MRVGRRVDALSRFEKEKHKDTKNSLISSIKWNIFGTLSGKICGTKTVKATICVRPVDNVDSASDFGRFASCVIRGTSVARVSSMIRSLSSGFLFSYTSYIVVVVLTLTRIIESVVTGQAPVNLELRNTPGKNTNKPKVVHAYQVYHS